jgi:outer membrane protein OmpA-like peptidoglycan-associated protein
LYKFCISCVLLSLKVQSYLTINYLLRDIVKIDKFKKTFNIPALCLFIALFCFLPLSTVADEVEDSLRLADLEVIDYDFFANSDTLSIRRLPTSFWFGALFGTNWSVFYGDIELPLIDNDPDLLGRTIDFRTGVGDGIFFGATAEWLPPLSDWGGILRLFFYDRKSGLTDTDPENDDQETHYTLESEYLYLTLQPTVRYDIKNLGGFHLYGGLDLELLLTSDVRRIKHFKNTAAITWETLQTVKPTSFRFGANFGVGYDIYSLDAQHSMRVFLTPFVSVHTGTNVFSHEIFGRTSDRNTIYLRTGFALRFTNDIAKYDTLKFNPSYVVPPEKQSVLAFETEVVFPNPPPFEKIPTEEIVRVERPVLDTIEPSVKFEEPPEEPPEELVVIPNKKKVLFFDKTLGTRDKEYLDVLVEYLSSNPKLNVRIVGHSDNTGTLAQNKDRSDVRAEQVFRYLDEKGISRGRLFKRGVGSIYPNETNLTDQGRRKNRRVEVIVIGR